MKGKIFCIGLMKTGTVSCAEALRILGYSVGHFDEIREVMEEDNRWLDGDLEKDYLGGFDAVFDNPLASFYPLLDKKYLDSKFILTVREEDDWLKSCKKYLSKVPAKYEYRKLVRTSVYGMYNFNKERWKFVLQRHLKEVKDYFKGREDDLLIINICDGEGWEKLCKFLGKDIPNKDFPKINVYPDYIFE